MGRVSRAEEFQASEVGIVHVVQRCVRRAWLAGIDDKTGKDFSFRREWIRRRMESLASVFAIDVIPNVFPPVLVKKPGHAGQRSRSIGGF